MGMGSGPVSLVKGPICRRSRSFHPAFSTVTSLSLRRPAEYNPHMDPIPAPEVDAWLRSGGIVVAASDRGARAIRAAFHRARRAEGLSAWPAPRIMDWNVFVRAEFDSRSNDARLALNATQEKSLWSRIVGDSEPTAGWLDAPRRRLADLAMQAHHLLCAYAPNLLKSSARNGWQQDAGVFSRWLSTFDERCKLEGLLSTSRLPLELLPLLESDPSNRPALVLAGFDRLLPLQQQILNAWGDWRPIAPTDPAPNVRFYIAPNEQMELAASALWCDQNLAANPHARLLIIAQDGHQRRGEIERAFLKHVGTALPLRFEFSLGVPLGQVALARTASLLLHWLDGVLEEHEIDWLFASSIAFAKPEEAFALQSYMRGLRRQGLQRTRWTLNALLRQPVASAPAQIGWTQRIAAAQTLLRRAKSKGQGPLDWAALVPQLLETIGWPGSGQLTSAEFQAASRWQQALDVCGSLGFDGRRMTWEEFLSELARALSETLFAEESQDAPILIAGPAESAGLNADAIWFLGADEDAWPPSGTTNPLLPIEAQREARMPHAAPQVDWDLAQSIAHRLLASAQHICFSYARQRDGVEMRPSRLVTQLTPALQPLPAELIPKVPPPPRTIAFEDTSRIALAAAPIKKGSAQLSLFDDLCLQPEPVKTREIPGGSTVLTSQSQCAFKAFAIARLGAQSWDFAEAGLTASQRGQLLHAVLHSLWGGPPAGIRTFNQLQNLGADLRAFVESHVRRVLAEEMPAGAREQMPPRYLELEQYRLTSLITEWLEYERTRLPFEVEATEVDSTTTIAGLTLKLRLDRIDRLNDGSKLVIDYKSGNVSSKSWELPRPDDIQLPLYAEFALPADSELGGLVFAKVRPGDMAFTGKVANAPASLNGSLKGSSGLAKNPLTPRQLTEWKSAIEQLARDFLAGRADVDPREYPNTCERCGLFTLCRVLERADELESEDEDYAKVDDE
jgi:ATP-dependent helicase/nuclease subunit B